MNRVICTIAPGLTAIALIVSFTRHADATPTPTATPPVIPALTSSPVPTTKPTACPTTTTLTDPVSGSGRRVYSGSGHKLIDIGRLDGGVYIVSATFAKEDGPSSGGFSVSLIGRTTGNFLLPFNELIHGASFADQTVIQIYDNAVFQEADDYLMEIEANGTWTVAIERA